jgi:tRNA threonylcarbamoyladenosine biosynthesis protein TsaB
MPALLIETSTERGMTALVEGDEVLYRGELPPGYQNSTYLLPAIEKGLKQLGLAAADLSYIAVGIGPGSYTGIRVGVAAAKALAFACQLPLIGVCTLRTFLPTRPGPFAVLIDAKIGGAYGIVGTLEGGNVAYQSEPEVVPLEKLSERLGDVQRLVTPQSRPLRDKLQVLYPDNPWIWEEAEPDAVQMARLARQLKEKGEIAQDGHLPLLYLRKTQAELERE